MMGWHIRMPFAPFRYVDAAVQHGFRSTTLQVLHRGFFPSKAPRQHGAGGIHAAKIDARALGIGMGRLGGLVLADAG
jgi:hypothetical protein